MHPLITMRVALRADDLRPGMTIDAAENGPADGRPIVVTDVERHMVDLDVWGRPPGYTIGKRWRVTFSDPTVPVDRYPTPNEAAAAWIRLTDALVGRSEYVRALAGTVLVKVGEVEVTVAMPGLYDEPTADPDPDPDPDAGPI